MTTSEMIAIVQIYIHIRKGVNVDIQPCRSLRDVALLQSYYNTAVIWLQENQIKIIKL